MSEEVQKWEHKRIVALASDGTVVQIDQVYIDPDDDDCRPVDYLLYEAGLEGWQTVSVNNMKFEGCDAMQYLLKRPLVETENK